MPVRKIEDLPPPPKLRADVFKSQYRRAFERSQMVELKGLKEMAYFELVDMKDIPRGRKMVNLKSVHIYKGDGFGNFIA